jgi:hypothetical protein
MAELGRLEWVDPRAVWLHEAADFTPWLLANCDRLADALGIELELDATEHPVGGYSLDLIGRDLNNATVLIVENQLATTDHSHLGQVLTYAAGTGASTIVWIATAFREEHRQALDWLNEHTDEDTRFFGVESSKTSCRSSSAPARSSRDANPGARLSIVRRKNTWFSCAFGQNDRLKNELNIDLGDALSAVVPALA